MNSPGPQSPHPRPNLINNHENVVFVTKYYVWAFIFTASAWLCIKIRFYTNLIKFLSLHPNHNVQYSSSVANLF